VYFFLHLLGANNAIVARRESLPGLGRYPSVQWAPDRIFCDNVPLRVEDSTPGPKVCDLEIGLVNLANGSRLPAVNVAGVELRPAILGRIKVRAPQPVAAAVAAQPGTIDLGGQFRLIGSEVAPSSIGAGNTISVTLIWRPVHVPVADYTVFIHLRNAAGKTVAQADSPHKQAISYLFWDTDETIVIRSRIPLPDNAAGDYTVKVGLYR
jgi:hypothetical protein